MASLIRDDMAVAEYVIVYKWEDKIQRMELQALSAQNVVDMFRNIYGTEIKILQVHKVMEDWQ